MLTHGISRLHRYDMKLCKVQSNSPLIRQKYPSKEALPNTMDLIKRDNSLPNETKTQALGLQWDIQEDKFSIKSEHKDRPKTKRGLLSHIMSPYDPQGITAPSSAVLQTTN